MPEVAQIVALLDLARAEERRFAARLAVDERTAVGTPEQPSPKDALGHVVGAKAALVAALTAVRQGRAPDPSHDREALHAANATRSFECVERDAERVGAALKAEVARLDAATLASSPGWIREETVADEIVQGAVTHSLIHLFAPLIARGDGADAVRAQEAFIAALPVDIGDLERSRGLYNLGCLYVGAGREDDALRAMRAATSRRPSLLEHALADEDLRQLWPRLVGS